MVNIDTLSQFIQCAVERERAREAGYGNVEYHCCSSSVDWTAILTLSNSDNHMWPHSTLLVCKLNVCFPVNVMVLFAGMRNCPAALLLRDPILHLALYVCQEFFFLLFL